MLYHTGPYEDTPRLVRRWGGGRGDRLLSFILLWFQQEGICETVLADLGLDNLNNFRRL